MSQVFAAAMAWWRGRTERERWMLGGLGAVVAALVAWYGVWAPLSAWSRDAGERLVVANAALAEAEGSAQEIARWRRSASRTGPVGAALARSAGDAGLTLAKNEPAADGGVTVWAEPAEPEAVFAWLTAVRAQLGLEVRALEMQGAEGGVQARITFQGAGS